jgi:hypothetical protein
MVQAGPGIKQDPISKITNTKRTGGMVQVVKHLPIKCKVLSSITSTNNNNNKKSLYQYNQKESRMQETETFNQP